MRNTSIKYGLIAGVILSIYMLITVQFMSQEADYSLMEIVGNLVMTLALLVVFYIGIKEERDVRLGGNITFGNVFKKAFLGTIVAAIIYSLAWTVYYNISDTNFIELMQEISLKEMQEEGLSDEEIASSIETMEAFLPYYEMPPVMFLFTILEPLIPGLIASLILGFILKRKDGFEKQENLVSNSE